MAVLVKNPERIRTVVQHMVTHYQTRVEPSGFKAQVVVFDRECCVLYKQVMDDLIGPEASAIVMHTSSDDPPEWKQHALDKDAEEKLLDRFRDPADPLKFVRVLGCLQRQLDEPVGPGLSVETAAGGDDGKRQPGPPASYSANGGVSPGARGTLKPFRSRETSV
jgi:hypothetical protein